jgi:hypothetical protein
MKTINKVSTFRLIFGIFAVLALTPCMVGAKPATSKKVVKTAMPAITTNSAVASGLGFLLYTSGGVEVCSYNQNHVFDFAGNVIGDRSPSDPTAVLDTNDNTIAWLLVPASE